MLTAIARTVNTPGSGHSTTSSTKVYTKWNDGSSGAQEKVGILLMQNRKVLSHMYGRFEKKIMFILETPLISCSASIWVHINGHVLYYSYIWIRPDKYVAIQQPPPSPDSVIAQVPFLLILFMLFAEPDMWMLLLLLLFPSSCFFFCPKARAGMEKKSIRTLFAISFAFLLSSPCNALAFRRTV